MASKSKSPERAEGTTTSSAQRRRKTQDKGDGLVSAPMLKSVSPQQTTSEVSSMTTDVMALMDDGDTNYWDRPPLLPKGEYRAVIHSATPGQSKSTPGNYKLDLELNVPVANMPADHVDFVDDKGKTLHYHQIPWQNDEGVIDKGRRWRLGQFYEACGLDKPRPGKDTLDPAVFGMIEVVIVVDHEDGLDGQPREVVKSVKRAL